MAKIDDEFMIKVPVLCNECSTPLSNKQIAYIEGKKKGESHESLMIRFGYTDRYCCAMHFTSPQHIPFGGPPKPYLSQLEYSVHPDVHQVWLGVMSRAPKTIPDATAPTTVNVGEIELIEADENITTTFKGGEKMTFGDLGEDIELITADQLAAEIDFDFNLPMQSEPDVIPTFNQTLSLPQSQPVPMQPYGQNPTQFPGQNPTQFPGQNPSQNPSQFPGQSYLAGQSILQSQYVGQNPGVVQMNISSSQQNQQSFPMSADQAQFYF